MTHDLFMVFIGMLFGLANVIPGVSGGTIAVVFGLYDRVIGIIADFPHRWKKELRFLITFGLGAGIGIVVVGRLLNWVLVNHPALASSFFVGVILGSIPMIAKKALYKGEKLVVNASSVVPAVITLGIMVVMALMGDKELAVSEQTGSYVLFFIRMFFSGIVAAACMIIPGISGSFVMMLLGVYGVVIGAVAQLTSAPFQALPALIPLGMGCLIGLFGCAKLIEWLMAHHEQATYSAILGFVIGSVFSVFPGWSAFFQVGPIIAFVVGVACILLCNHYSAE